MVGGDISFVDLDADARKRAKSGTSFETEGDSVIALDDVSRPRSASSRFEGRDQLTFYLIICLYNYRH